MGYKNDFQWFSNNKTHVTVQLVIAIVLVFIAGIYILAGATLLMGDSASESEKEEFGRTQAGVFTIFLGAATLLSAYLLYSLYRKVP